MKKKILLLFFITVFLCLPLCIACTPKETEIEKDNYSITFVIDGQILETINYSVGNDNFGVPNVPSKQYYAGEWEEYTLFENKNITVNAVYTPITYHIIFQNEDGEEIEKISYDCENTEITEPSVPEKAEHNGRWQDYSLQYLEEQVIKPIYIEKLTFTITFVVEGEGGFETSVYFIEGEPQTDVPTIPEKAHYKGAWDSSVFDTTKTITAIYTPITYHIIFQNEDGEEIEKISYDCENTEIIEPGVPDKEHYVGKWVYAFNYSDNQTVKPTYVRTANVVFETSYIYNRSDNGNKQEISYFKAFPSIVITNGDSWNLPVLQDCELHAGKTVSYECKNLKWVYLAQDGSIKAVDTSKKIDLSKFNFAYEITLYIMADVSSEPWIFG